MTTAINEPRRITPGRAPGALPGLVITRATVAGRRPAVGVLLPEIVLAAAMVYLATVLTLFHTGQIAALARLVATESLLVGGLFIMFYGSIANLTLGKNGYTTGFTGNNAGMVLLVGAAVFLFAIRGMLKASTARRSPIPSALVTNLAFAAGAIVFFYGERSVIIGHAPSPSVGAAFPAALVIAVAGLLILVPGRMLARQEKASTA
ncbi:MAG: hypothetical protein ACRDS0_32945 [Pseudonocardiaceae bacterium]